MRIVDVSTQEGYDRWAATYDTKPNPLIVLDTEALAAGLQAQGHDLQGKRALDLGCGTGRNSRVLADCGAEVTAVDFSEGMLDVARVRANAPRIRFVHHDLGEPLPFSDGSFEVIVCTLVLEHIEDLRRILGEMRRVCTGAGWVYISDVHPCMRQQGGRAQFSDRARDEEVRPAGFGHTVADYRAAIRHARLEILSMSERAGTSALVDQVPKALKYLGTPMLLVFVLKPR